MNFSCSTRTKREGLLPSLMREPGYFDVSPIDLGENVRRDIVLNLEDMGFEVEASHHEIAPAQHEIDLQYTEGLEGSRSHYDF